MSSVKHRATRHPRHGKPVKLGAGSARTAIRIAGVVGLLLLGTQAVAASTSVRPRSSQHQADTAGPWRHGGGNYAYWYRKPHPSSSSPKPTKSSTKSTSAAPTSAAPTTAASISSAVSSTSASSTPPPTSTTSSTSPSPTSPPPTGGGTAGSSVHNCVVLPSGCGYPDASNTGVPASVVLKSVPSQVSSGPGWHWDSRGWVEVDGNNALFTGYSVNATVDVTADNVIISNNKITVGGDTFGVSLRHTVNAIVSHNSITGLAASGTGRLMNGVKDIYGDAVGTQVLGNNIARTATGVQMDGGLIADNYIHDLGLSGADHVNGTTSNGTNGQQLIIRHNTVLDPWDQTDAISLFQDFSAQTNRIIDNNLLSGGSYSLYGGQQDGGSPTSYIVITNNRFATNYYTTGGYFGTVAHYDPHGTGNIWTNNYLDTTGASITP
jgi:phage baseplate assembly protein gpV